MTATDHLQGAQFMPMSDIMKLTSVDAEAENDYRVDAGLAPRGTQVADILPQKLHEVETQRDRYAPMEQSMRQHGLTAPIAVNAGYLLNGGHRVAEAYRQGWTGMHVTSDFENSTDRTWDAAHPRSTFG
jgi:hypothetical protein